ncbi:MAG TPA: dolichyl-phosphate beta-glucosyltransferase [Terriglobales bacterium]|jgi:dolichyl-phosphate beta-glucosyltransferase|nr:dolichyl-phosphate beta-glucosyltransferase [Terriglobales bacterium]
MNEVHAIIADQESAEIPFREAASVVAYSIVIPAYNEAERISATLDQILAYVYQQHWSAEIIVVDDGSTDSTAEIVRKFAAAHSSIRLIRSPRHFGKGHTVRAGALEAAGKIVLVVDADLPSHLREAHKLFAALGAGTHIAIASRWLDPALHENRQSFSRRCFSRCFNVLVRFLLGLNFKDTQCGFKAFTDVASSLIFRLQSLQGWGFDVELLLIAKRLGLGVKEVSVRTRHDPRSRLSPVRHGFEMLFDVVGVFWRDLWCRYPSPLASSLRLSAQPAGTKRWAFRFGWSPVTAALAMLVLAAATTTISVRETNTHAASNQLAAASAISNNQRLLSKQETDGGNNADIDSANDEADYAFDQE